jgi:hypothetical protein
VWSRCLRKEGREVTMGGWGTEGANLSAVPGLAWQVSSEDVPVFRNSKD